MPKKTAKKSKSTKSTKSTKSSVKKSTTATKATTPHPLHKKYLHTEQEDFFAQNPSAKPLLIIFMLLAVAAFIYIIQVQGLLVGVML